MYTHSKIYNFYIYINTLIKLYKLNTLHICIIYM